MPVESEETEGRTSDRFGSALEAVELMTAEEREYVAPECGSRLLHHGGPTSSAFLLFHGFTNCPAQMSVIAEELYRRGHNVFVPLEEGHGRADRSPAFLTHITPDKLTAWIARMVAVAAGLGERVVVAGFSVGGVYAAWAAVHHDEVDDVVLLSPAFLPYSFPLAGVGLLPGLSRILPERYLWWDPLRRDAAPLSPYTYPRLSRRGITAVFTLGQKVTHQPAPRTRPLERGTLVLNEWDFAVSPKAAKRAFEKSVGPLATNAETIKLEAALRLPHDYLDPHRPGRESARQSRTAVARIIEGDGASE